MASAQSPIMQKMQKILIKNGSSDRQNIPISRSEIATRLMGLMEKEVGFEGNYK